MNLELARGNMIAQQIRAWEVLDARVLAVIGALPREDFVPPRYRNLAYADMQIPLPHGQVMMAPKVEGRMLQALAPQPGERVLEIGTGTGYVTALLAGLAGEVVSIDIYEDFAAAASTRLGKLGIANVRLEAGDGLHGWPGCAPYDAIAVTGSLPQRPRDIEEQLAVGGRLFVVVGEPPVEEALLVTRAGDREWSVESLFETLLPPLIGARRPPRFAL